MPLLGGGPFPIDGRRVRRGPVTDVARRRQSLGGAAPVSRARLQRLQGPGPGCSSYGPRSRCQHLGPGSGGSVYTSGSRRQRLGPGSRRQGLYRPYMTRARLQRPGPESRRRLRPVGGDAAARCGIMSVSADTVQMMDDVRLQRETPPPPAGHTGRRRATTADVIEAPPSHAYPPSLTDDFRPPQTKWRSASRRECSCSPWNHSG